MIVVGDGRELRHRVAGECYQIPFGCGAWEITEYSKKMLVTNEKRSVRKLRGQCISITTASPAPPTTVESLTLPPCIFSCIFLSLDVSIPLVFTAVSDTVRYTRKRQDGVVT
jgi:hypothetical protein